MKVNLDAWANDYAGTLYALARDDFGLFRQLIHPDFLWVYRWRELAVAKGISCWRERSLSVRLEKSTGAQGRSAVS